MTDAFAHLSSGFPPHGEGNGGDEGNRTLDPLLAGQVLSQLSYTPVSLRPVPATALKIEQQPTR